MIEHLKQIWGMNGKETLVFFLAISPVILWFTAHLVILIRNQQKRGLWSWSKFAFALVFGIADSLLISLPMIYLSQKYFLVMIGSWILAALIFIWFLYVMRNWRMTGGRTSLQAWRDDQKSRLRKDLQ